MMQRTFGSTTAAVMLLSCLIATFGAPMEPVTRIVGSALAKRNVTEIRPKRQSGCGPGCCCCTLCCCCSSMPPLPPSAPPAPPAPPVVPIPLPPMPPPSPSCCQTSQPICCPQPTVNNQQPSPCCQQQQQQQSSSCCQQQQQQPQWIPGIPWIIQSPVPVVQEPYPFIPQPHPIPGPGPVIPGSPSQNPNTSCCQACAAALSAITSWPYNGYGRKRRSLAQMQHKLEEVRKKRSKTW